MSIYKIKLQEPFKAIVTLNITFCNDNLDVCLTILLPDLTAKLAIQLLLRNTSKDTELEQLVYEWAEDNNNHNSDSNISIILSNELDYQAITRILHAIFGSDAYRALIDINQHIDTSIATRISKQNILPISSTELFLPSKSTKHTSIDNEIIGQTQPLNNFNDMQTVMGLLLFSGFSYEEACSTATEQASQDHCLSFIHDVEDELNKDKEEIIEVRGSSKTKCIQ